MPPPTPATTAATTSASNTPAKPPVRVETYVGGFLFNSLDQIRHLLIDYYGVPESEVDDMGPLDMSTLYYNEHIALDSPDFIHVPYRFPDSPDVDREGWLLPCRLAFVRVGRKPPSLDFDHRVQRYAEKWFPKALRDTEPFKGIRYIMTPHPKKYFPSPFLRRKLKQYTDEGHYNSLLLLAKWVQDEEAAGRVVSDLPPRLHTSYRVRPE